MSKILKLKQKRHLRRKISIRKTLKGDAEMPRVSIFRSNNHIYAQVINDYAMNTIASFSDSNLKDSKGTAVEKAKQVGIELGKLVKSKKIDKIRFDRSGYKYHGRVKALADGLRESGIQL